MKMGDVCAREMKRTRVYLPLVGTLFVFILCSNYLGLVPGFMAPTSSINVTLGCALTIWVYYHFQGFKEQGVVNYIKHFALPPGSPLWMAPLMFVIEIISHLSRVMSLSLRLFGNIFGEELVIAILFGLVPFIIPLPMMFLGLITGGLQAFIFVLLSIIYLQGAVAVEMEAATILQISARRGVSAACVLGVSDVPSSNGSRRSRGRRVSRRLPPRSLATTAACSMSFVTRASPSRAPWSEVSAGSRSRLL